MDNTLCHNCNDGCYMTTFITLCEHVDELREKWLNKTKNHEICRRILFMNQKNVSTVNNDIWIIQIEWNV